MTFVRSRFCWLAVACFCSSNIPHGQAFAAPFVSIKKTDHRFSTRASPLFSSSETAAGTTPPSEPSPPSLVPSKASVNGASKTEATFPSQFSRNLDKWLEKMRKISNFASFLCVLDCTILPVITVALPLLGVLQLPAAQLQMLHQLGHSLALYFVLPVGSLTTLVNYASHKKSWISSLAIAGLCLVGLANSHLHLHNAPQWVSTMLHMIQHGPWHRVTNISGCALLLGSNYLSQQQGCAFHDHSRDGDCDHGDEAAKSCSHDHSHKDHDHGHDH